MSVEKVDTAMDTAMDTEFNLSGHFEGEHAVRYASVLKKAGVSADIATEITLAELRELLPDASVGDRIRLLKCLREPPPDPLQASLPDTPSWRGLKRFLTNGEDLREKSNKWSESTIVTSSLILGVSAAAVLAPIDCTYVFLTFVLTFG